MMSSVWCLELMWIVVRICRCETVLASSVADCNEPLRAFIEDVEKSFFCGSKQMTIIIDPGSWMFQECLHTVSFPRRIFTVDTLIPEDAKNFRSVQKNFYVFLVGKRMDAMREWLSCLPRTPETPIALVTKEEASNVIEDAMSALWSAQFVNAVVVAINQSSTNAYGYIPYPPSKSKGGVLSDGGFYEISTPILVGSWDGRKRWTWKTSPFPRNERLDLNGRVLRCATGMAPWSVIWNPVEPIDNIRGVSISLIRVLEDIYNFTCRFQGATDDRSWGWVFEDGSSVGITGDLLKAEADLWVGDILPLEVYSDTLDLTAPFTESCLTWAIPSQLGELRSTWNLIVSDFSFHTWMMYFTALLSSTMFVFVLSRAVSLPERHKNFRNLLFLIFYQISTGIQVPRKTPPANTPMRAFYALWFLFSLVMATAYNAELWRLLMQPWGRKDILELQEMLDMGLNITIHPNFKRMLYEISGSNKTIQTLAEKAIPDLEIGDVFRLIAIKRNTVTFIVRSNIEFAATVYNNKAVGKRIHIFPGCAINMLSSSIALKKGSALTPQLNDAIERIAEAGLLSEWLRMTKPIPVERVDERGVPISIRNIVGAFDLLIAGLFYSTVAFIAERVWWGRMQRQSTSASPKVSTCSKLQRVELSQTEVPDRQFLQ